MSRVKARTMTKGKGRQWRHHFLNPNRHRVHYHQSIWLDHPLTQHICSLTSWDSYAIHKKWWKEDYESRKSRKNSSKTEWKSRNFSAATVPRCHGEEAWRRGRQGKEEDERERTRAGETSLEIFRPCDLQQLRVRISPVPPPHHHHHHQQSQSTTPTSVAVEFDTLGKSCLGARLGKGVWLGERWLKVRFPLISLQCEKKKMGLCCGKKGGEEQPPPADDGMTQDGNADMNRDPSQNPDGEAPPPEEGGSWVLRRYDPIITTTTTKDNWW